MAFSSVRANRGTALSSKAITPRGGARKSLVVEARATRAGVGLMGTKAGMTTVFQEDGSAVACTVIGFESANYITRVFTSDADGYDAVQVQPASYISWRRRRSQGSARLTMPLECTHTEHHVAAEDLLSLVDAAVSVSPDRLKCKLLIFPECQASEGHNGLTLQVGYKEVKEKNLKKPEVGHCKKAGVPPLRHLCEFKVKDASQLEGMEVGQQLDMTTLFEKDQTVDVAGMTIGKGFQGSIKRWGHKRGPMSHGMFP